MSFYAQKAKSRHCSLIVSGKKTTARNSSVFVGDVGQKEKELRLLFSFPFSPSDVGQDVSNVTALVRRGSVGSRGARR